VFDIPIKLICVEGKEMLVAKRRDVEMLPLSQSQGAFAKGAGLPAVPA
jgi:hypothetical protein